MTLVGGARAHTIALTSAIVWGICLLVAHAAVAEAPTGDFAQFAQCPRFAPGVELCLVVHIVGGEVEIGSMRVPIDRDMLFQGGLIPGSSGETFVEAIGGQTLSKTPQTVPGGLSGLLQPSVLPISVRKELTQTSGSQGVAAVTELVGTPQISTTALEIREGTALSLPLRVKLENPLLGRQCYI